MNLQTFKPSEDFLREEVRSGHTVTAKQKELWAVQLDMLEYFVEFCDKYHLHYYLDSGTLLGAVRHQGYIPWDDDIDIVMMRSDYNRFQHLAMKYMKEPYFCQSIYNDPLRLYPHIQIRNSNTALWNGNDDDVRYNHGIFIDIFPLDGIANDPVKSAEHLTQLKMYWIIIQKLANPNMVFEIDVEPLMKDIPDVTIPEFYRDFERLASKYSGTDEADYCDVVWFRMLGIDARLRYDWYKETVLLPFEHLHLPCPKCYDEVLKAYFGDDYMTPKKGGSLHGEFEYDTHRSYKEVLWGEKED